ncbi:MAG: desulfoferrodoxin [Kiritimatiellaeota bacterium]|nr:desulfoferrodoxin [Kiritimatiellota bacterium]
MRDKQKFFICKHCGNLIGLIDGKGVPMVCCGEKMSELVPNTVDAASEKHLPVVKRAETCVCGCACGNALTIEIGGIPHPMLEEHHIRFVYIETENGGKRRCLNIGQAPAVQVCCCDDKPVAVYGYCNLHGLWKTDL